jgi:hypothetical protein
LTKVDAYARAEDSYLDWEGRLVPLRDREMLLVIAIYWMSLLVIVASSHQKIPLMILNLLSFIAIVVGQLLPTVTLMSPLT